MEGYEFAARRYRQIVPEPLQVLWDTTTMRRIRTWLKDDVGPVVAKHACHPEFRRHASWPITALRPGAATPERLAVDQIAGALRPYAKALDAVAGSPRIKRKLIALNPPREIVIREEVTISARGSVRTGATRGSHDELALERAQAAELAAGDLPSLVRIDDYFGPVQEFTVDPDGRRVQHGHLVVSLNPEFHALGDFVVQGLFRRLEWWQGPLESLFRRCAGAVRAAGRRSVALEKVAATRRDLETECRELETACCAADDVLVRDACIVLTQAYAAFHPKPQIEWLELSPSVVDRGADAIRGRLNRSQGAEMCERIATALTGLRRLYGTDDVLREAEKAEAIASGGLVLVEPTRSAYWQTSEIAPPLSAMSWRFLWKLAERARIQGAVGQQHLYDDAMSETIMSTNRERLSNRLPDSLDHLIVTGQEKGTYRLELDPSRIHIVRRQTR